MYRLYVNINYFGDNLLSNLFAEGDRGSKQFSCQNEMERGWCLRACVCLCVVVVGPGGRGHSANSLMQSHLVGTQLPSVMWGRSAYISELDKVIFLSHLVCSGLLNSIN